MRKEWLLWVRFYTELKQTVLNSWYVKTTGVHRGIKTGIWPWLEIETKNQNFLENDVSSSIPINWFISYNDRLFAGTTLTLHKNQVYCPGVMQWWVCRSLMSAPLPAEAGWQTCQRSVFLMVYIRGYQTLPGHAPLQHFIRWACTPNHG